MIKEIKIHLLPSEAHSHALIRKAVIEYLSPGKNSTIHFEILKKSIDARGRQVKILCVLRVYIDEVELPLRKKEFTWNDVSNGKEIHIIGAGPAGLFCALRCIERGFKPIIIERGKMVRERRRDLALLNKQGILNEESNYCFGEGGAGTYSDGKLYTRSNKRGSVERILDLFHHFGAGENILYESHPHIGTNKLPQIIESIRDQILACGGEIHFNSRITDFDLKNNTISSIVINHIVHIPIQNLVLATGHSASDIYELLYAKNIQIESKPFAMGIRIEHPQQLIDQIQYHCEHRDVYLPPSSYSLVEQVNGRGVFSFCMCPGGIIAPASTKSNTLVVNGWSPSKRNNPFANSGMVVALNEEDFGADSPLDGLKYQFELEKKCFQFGGGNYQAPAQRMVDFVNKKNSSTLPACSYIPGVQSALFHEVLPPVIYDSLSKALLLMGKKMKGYFTNDAIMVATESRTSSPIRIPRDPISLKHIRINNLYPCAEGAGYAGGIVSAAMDGMKIAETFQNN